MGGRYDDVRLSKYLSRVLRHAPDAGGVTLDREGWAEIDALLGGASANGLPLDRAALERVVATNDKRRFTLSDDGARIRAAQGHSTAEVTIAYPPAEPPAELFHGTAWTNLQSIMATGLEPHRRRHVHLSPDRETALRVGRRHGAPVVLGVDAGAMAEEGHVFHQADNGVWLTTAVPPHFLRALD